MIEVRRISMVAERETGTAKKFEKGLEPRLYVGSIYELFANLKDFLVNIDDKVNLYYTLGHAKQNHEGPGRTWQSQDVISFDIDHCTYTAEGRLAPGYVKAFNEALGTSEYCLVATGYGVQLLIPLAKPITEKSFFEKHKLHYSIVLQKIKDALLEAKLAGTPDPSAFEANRLHRLPGTINRKEGRPDRNAVLINGLPKTAPDWNLVKCSGLPDVSEADELPIKQVSKLSLDVHEIQTCEFLKWAKQNQNAVTEPEWYAMLTIVSRLDDDGALAHEYSKDYKGYRPNEVERKILYAKTNAGPRTCKNVNALWGKCNTCPHNGKVTSPISLKGKDFIATRDAGFWYYDKNGKPTKPDYEGLLKEYENKHAFINLKDLHYIYKDSHFELVDLEYAKMFAENTMSPKPVASQRSEFAAKVEMYNRAYDADTVRESGARKINFQNGVLDLTSGTLLDHSPELFFTQTLNYGYDPIARAPLFEKFLDDITVGREELKNILLEYMGYAISGDDSRAHKFLVCTGTGANGKSTLMQILQALVGGTRGKAFSTVPFHSLGQEFSNIRLFNKLFNIMDESEIYLEKRQFETLKDMVAGGLVSGSYKFKDAIEFKNTAKFILLVNEIPKGATPNKGLYRRFLIVPFDATFEGAGADKFLAEKIIAEELPGIMNMVLDGYYRLRARGFNFPETAVTSSELNKYKEENDNVARWCTAHVKQGEARIVSVRDLRKHYETYVREDGEVPVAINQFTKRLLAWCKDKKIEFNYHPQKKLNNRNVAAIEGLSLDGEEF